MQKSSKVTKAIYTNRTWESPYGLMHFHRIEFENGDNGEYMAKADSQNKFVVGQEAEYTIEPPKKEGQANKIKPVNKGGNGYSGGRGGYKQDPEIERMRSRCMIASYVKDLIVASGWNDKKSCFNMGPEQISAYHDALAKKVFNEEKHN